VKSSELSEMQDIDLLRQYNAGDPDAFLALFHRYRKPLYNFILRNIRYADAAEDLLQDVFVRIIQGAEDFRGESKFTTWLYTIARNLCIDRNRKMVLRRHVSLDERTETGYRHKDPGAPRQVPDETPGVDRNAISNRLRQQIAIAVEALPEEQREVFLMRQLQNLPFQEIAIIVGVSENTIKSRMRYALERLRELLNEYDDYTRSPD
jgi:RNA polymerase sigma-70 factor, ECF subfamily